MSNHTLTAHKGTFLGPGVYERIEEIVSTFIFPILLMFCLSGNVINIIVFFKLGLKDSVTISFFALSLSDLLYILLSSVLTVCRSMSVKDLVDKLEAESCKSIIITITSYEFIFSDFSMLITTYIAVTRCCCVAMPFKFKGVFTVYQTNITLTVMFVINVALKLPFIASIGLALKTDPVTGKLKVDIQVPDKRQTMKDFHNIVNQNCLRYVTTIINVMCVVVQVYKLHIASRRRWKLTGSSKFHSSNKLSNISSKTRGSRRSTRSDKVKRDGAGSDKRSDNYTDGKPSCNLSIRDQQVVIVAVLVSAVFVMDAMFSACVALTKLVDPEISPNGLKPDLFNFFTRILNFVKYINAGINLVIYFNFNSKYRHVIESWFQCCHHGTQDKI